MRSCGPCIAVGAGNGEGRALVKRDGSVARDGHCRNGTDGQVEGVNLGASVGVHMSIRVGAALSISGAVPRE